MKIIVFLLTLVFTQISYSQNCDSLFVSSLKHFDEENLEQAITDIELCISACPNEEKFHLHAAKCYYEIKNFPKTSTSLNNAININDSCVEAYALKAHIFLGEGYYNEAIKNYERIFEVMPATDSFDIVYHVNLSQAYIQTNQYEKALKYLKIANKVDSTSIELNSNLAVCYIQLGNEKEAVKYLDKCLELDPQHTGGFINMGFYLTEKGKYEEAITYFNKALAIQPREAFALNNRGYTFYKMGDYEKALDDINQSIVFDPSNSYAYKNRALVYIKMGVTSDACADLTKAIKLGFTEMYGDEAQILKNEMCGSSK